VIQLCAAQNPITLSRSAYTALSHSHCPSSQRREFHPVNSLVGQLLTTETWGGNWEQKHKRSEEGMMVRMKRQDTHENAGAVENHRRNVSSSIRNLSC